MVEVNEDGAKTRDLVEGQIPQFILEMILGTGVKSDGRAYTLVSREIF